MGRSQESYSKKEKEKKRRKKKKEKAERREQRKLEKAERGTKTFEEQLSYVDADGNLTSTPPDPAEKVVIKAEDIVLGVPPKDKTIFETTRKGKVKFFDGEKGYGFILDLETQESVFVHMSNSHDPLQENDKVTFTMEMGPKGPSAMDVRLATTEAPVPEEDKTE